MKAYTPATFSEGDRVRVDNRHGTITARVSDGISSYYFVQIDGAKDAYPYSASHLEKLPEEPVSVKRCHKCEC